MVYLQVRYTIDHYKHAEFEEYCRNWKEPVEKAGGRYLGHFLPTSLAGPTTEALCLIEFKDTAAYEEFRSRLASDPIAAEKHRYSAATRCIVREERSFLRLAE